MLGSHQERPNVSLRRNLSNRTDSVSVKSVKVKGYKYMVTVVLKKCTIPAVFLLSHLKRKRGIFFKLYFKLANPLVYLRETLIAEQLFLPRGD